MWGMHRQVMELGQVGLAADEAGGSSAFIVHSQKGQGFGDAGALADAFLQAGDAKVGATVICWGGKLYVRTTSCRLTVLPGDGVPLDCVQCPTLPA